MGDVLASEDLEGRGRLRKAWGSRQTGVDPEQKFHEIGETIHPNIYHSRGCNRESGFFKTESITISPIETIEDDGFYKGGSRGSV
jgi:hypothetical protein